MTRCSQADVLGEVFLVELERWRDRRVQHLDLVAEDLDLAGGQVGVGRAGRARTHLAGDLQAELVAYRFGDLEGLGAIRVADDLGQAFAVAQVDEDDAAVVAATVGPAAQGDDLAVEGGVELSAVMGTHGNSVGLLRCGDDAKVCGGGATTPIEMMYLRASSTVMSSSTTSCRHHQEEAGGRVGRGRYVDADVVAVQMATMSPPGLPVRKAMVQLPWRGYWTSSALRKALPLGEKACRKPA
jgi:hypothetical protein